MSNLFHAIALQHLQDHPQINLHQFVRLHLRHHHHYSLKMRYHYKLKLMHLQRHHHHLLDRVYFLLQQEQLDKKRTSFMCKKKTKIVFQTLNSSYLSSFLFFSFCFTIIFKSIVTSNCTGIIYFTCFLC